jgi:hypothetical protein
MHGKQISLSSERTSWLSYHGLWPQELEQRLARIASLCSPSFANSRRGSFEYRAHRSAERRFKLRVAHLNAQTLRQRAAETGAHTRAALKPRRGFRAVVSAGQRDNSQHPRVPVNKTRRHSRIAHMRIKKVLPSERVVDGRILGEGELEDDERVQVSVVDGLHHVEGAGQGVLQRDLRRSLRTRI